MSTAAPRFDPSALAKFGKLLLAGLIAGKKVIAMFFVIVAAGLRKFWNRRKDRVSQA